MAALPNTEKPLARRDAFLTFSTASIRFCSRSRITGKAKMASKEAVIRFLRIRGGFRRRTDGGLAFAGCPECFFARTDTRVPETWPVFSFGELAWAACEKHRIRWCVGSPTTIVNASETSTHTRQIVKYVDVTLVRAPDLGRLLNPMIREMLEAFVSLQDSSEPLMPSRPAKSETSKYATAK
jgi:hypothetical protein